jgi:hypothetical protein
VALPATGFGFGLGAIGAQYDDCRERVGELVAVGGCVAYFPSDGARMADYLVADGAEGPRVVLASGITCQGGFSRLVRFEAQAGSEGVPVSELAGVCLEASGARMAGLVVAAESVGLAGARLRRSPALAGGHGLRFEPPLLRDWLAFAPERTYARSTALIAGVVARAPAAPLSNHLRPLGFTPRLSAHFHAAVFTYRPLPQRTVELGVLVKGLFTHHQLRDVLHLLWDDRGEGGVGESLLVRGVAWVAPINEVT